MGDRHIHRDDLRKVWKECREEGFWYRGTFFKDIQLLTNFIIFVANRRDKPVKWLEVWEQAVY